MRITNKMMTNNMLSNINKNKINMNKLEQQYSTGKKIQRPSEDPIIAVRALKLRTNLTEIEQYYEKNIPDAKSWMNVTESALQTVNEVLRKINTYCVQGSTDTLTATDRNSIVQNLQEMKQQIFQEGNTNYAGRYVFTGFKTNSPLVFNEKSSNLNYTITEEFKGLDIHVIKKVSGAYNISDFDDEDIMFYEPPTQVNSYRLQLSYDKLDSLPPTNIQYTKTVAGVVTEQPPFTNITSISVVEKDAFKPADDAIHYIPETGELILGKNVYEEFRTADNMKITYQKSNFEEGELRPEHYFNCVVTDHSKPELEPITYTKTKQEIQYEVNYNQRLTINTQASDAITHKIGRVIDDIVNSINDVMETELKISQINTRLVDSDLTQADKIRYERMLEQLDTELVLKKDIMQKAYERGITGSNVEQDRVNVAVADLGSRYVRLELIESRLSIQKTDFTELLSTNEDADLVDTIVKFNSAQTIYNAALSAAAKVVKNTLLDFL